MQRLEAWNIITTVVKAPFIEWRLFLRSAAIPTAVYGSFLALSAMDASRMVSSTDTVIVYADALIRSCALTIFTWSWLTGLLHGQTNPHGSNPRLWLQFVAMFTAVTFLSQVVSVLPAELFSRVMPKLDGALNADQSDQAQSLRLVQAFVTGGVLLLLAWVMARLTPWRAWVIDRGTIIGPQAVWRQTKGHAWLIFLIGMAVWLPILAILFGIALLPPQLAGNTISIAVFQLLELCIEAAGSAVSLLIYRGLTQTKTNLDVF